MKICSLYGEGFFYIPGTDTCLKIGGYLREQYDIHGAGDGQVYMDTNGATWTRGFTNNSSFRTRSVLTFDVREQSSFGTVRGYTAVGGDLTTGNAAGAANAIYFTRSFVQFAGITAGKAVSFFDFLSTDPYLYASNIRPNFGNTGATGIDVLAYTAQLGNGVSATVSAEDSCSGNVAGSGGSVGGRQCKVINSSVGPFAAVAFSGTGTIPVSGTGLLTADPSQLVLQSQTGGSMAPGVATYNAQGYVMPDIVGALRADQAWGSAQLSGALHKNAGDYYFNATSATTAVPTGVQANGHPGDVYGWAVAGGFLLKNVLGMQGDAFGLQANYSVGATSYVTNAAGSLSGFSGGTNGLGNSMAFGSVVDGVYTSGAGTAATGGSSIEMTTAWTAGGVYEHVWNPQWKTSVMGAYVGVSYNDTAANYICNGSFNSVVDAWAGGRCTFTGIERRQWILGTDKLRSELLVLVVGHPHAVEPELEPRSRSRLHVEPPQPAPIPAPTLRRNSLAGVRRATTASPTTTSTLWRSAPSTTSCPDRLILAD